MAAFDPALPGCIHPGCDTEVRLGATAPARWAFELALPNGFVVRAADAAALAQLLAVVRS